MKAATVTANGLEVHDVPEPRPAANEVLVRVRACGLNRADLSVAAGQVHGRQGGAGTIPGLEWAGDVAAVGSEVTHVRPGDRVMCSGAGAYAEYGVSDLGRTMLIPAGMSFEQAAVLPVALQTMHDAVVTNGRLAKGEAVMVLGASSGVGLMALQIARRMGARFVVGTSTTAARRARLKEFGADLAVDTAQAGWPDEVVAATGARGCDLIIDQLAGNLINDTMKAAALRGRIVNVGRMAGTKATFDFDLHAMKRLDYIGVTFRTRSIEEVREITRRMRADLWADVETGRLTLPIDRTFALPDVAAAVAHMKANAHLGKIVLEG